MVEISRQLFCEWNRLGVNYCHWKSNEHLLAGLDGETDLDVLLDEKDRDSAVVILNELDFLFCKSQYGSRYPNVEDWIGFDKGTGNLIHLHLHFKIVTGHKGMKEYTLPWSEECLNSRIQDPYTNVFVSNPNLEIVTLYSRIGLKATPVQIAKAKQGKYVIEEGYLREIAFLKACVDWSVVRKYLNIYYKGQADIIYKIMQLERIDSISFIKLSKVTKVVFKCYSRYSPLSRIIRNWFYFFIMKILKWIKYKRHCNIILRKTPFTEKGLVIAFLGQDGSGKSTVTEIIEKWLKWKLEATKFYLGSGDCFKPWEKTLQLRVHNRKSIFSKVLRAYLPFRIYLKLSRVVKDTILDARKYANKGGFAIFDRFPQVDYLGINDGPKIRTNLMSKTSNAILKSIASLYANREEKNLKRAVCMEPDIVVKLTLSPEESVRRKPENQLEAMKKKHEIIANLKFQDAKVYEIDAEQNFEKEIIQIKSIIWQNIHK